MLAKYEYELNDAGYREQVKESLLQPDGSIVERTIDYDYDELYRLLEAMIQGGETVSYAYDDVGNRLSQTSSQETREYFYDDNDRLIQELVNDVAVVTYTYDNNGNLKTRTEGGETVNYLWDDQNRLIEVQTPSETINYAYDDDNIRVSQTVGGETTSYLLDKNRPYAQVLAEYTNGNLDASYVYGLDLISQERNNIDSYYLVDGLGSTRGLTDENGNVTDVYHYDAYGNLTDSVGSSENNYLFAGEQFDENLDQYYLRQRYYDPSVGRFTRRDTYEGRNFEPITLHKYLYANANPINGIDPSGLFTLTEVAAARQVRNTLASVQTHSYLNLVKESGDQGRKIANFTDLFLTTADIVGNLRELIIGGLLIGSYLQKGSIAFWEKVAKYKFETFEKLSKSNQKIANEIYDRFLQQHLHTGVGKPISEIRNVRNLKDGLYEIKHKTGVRVYIDEHGNRLGYSLKGKQQNQAINKIKSFLKQLKSGEADKIK